jgi:dihydropteroate synthase
VLQQRLEELWESGRPVVMGVVNVTPDSFSDGGRFAATEAAVAQGAALFAAGAAIVDVGGESTRPGSMPVSAEEEQGRVVPVIGALAARFPAALISVDTSKGDVAAAAISAGAVVVNDVRAGADPAMFPLVAGRDAGIVLMHMRGEPRTMQSDTRYDDVVAEVHGFLTARAAAARTAGIAAGQVLLDPGIGFGKDVAGNLALLRALPDLAALGYPIVVGASRKSFIGELTGATVEERLPGSLAALSRAIGLARAVVRVHDAAETIQFLTVLAALESVA